MSEAKHIATPWISGVMGTSKSDETICYVRSVASDPVDAMYGAPDICIASGDGNAEFIVRACNAHDDLLAACIQAKVYLAPDLVEPGRTVFWNLVNAIKKAEGKS